jgi:hypothetical protein
MPEYQTADGQPSGGLAQMGGIDDARGEVIRNAPLPTLAIGDGGWEQGLMGPALAAGSPQLEQRVPGQWAGKNDEFGIGRNEESMRPRLTRAVENGVGCRQVEIGDRDRLGRIEVNVDEIAGFGTKQDAEVLPIAKVVGQVLGAELEIGPAPANRVFLAGGDRDETPPALQILAREIDRVVGAGGILCHARSIVRLACNREILWPAGVVLCAGHAAYRSGLCQPQIAPPWISNGKSSAERVGNVSGSVAEVTIRTTAGRRFAAHAVPRVGSCRPVWWPRCGPSPRADTGEGQSLASRAMRGYLTGIAC